MYSFKFLHDKKLAGQDKQVLEINVPAKSNIYKNYYLCLVNIKCNCYNRKKNT